ncbi:MAG: lysozyme family protein [Clostridiales bacterium]|nr:lysozyme family protein [Clostridiales bacterium]
MGTEIKTRQVHKDIKMLDKAVTGTERIKRAYVRTKDSAEQIQEPQNATPVEYAEDKLSYYTDTAVHETAHQVRKQGGKIVDTVKEKRRSSKEIRGMEQAATDVKAAAYPQTNQPKEQIKKKAQEQAGKRMVQANGEMRRIKTIERGEKTIKTVQNSSKMVKATGKGTVKSTTRSIKTAEQTARTTIKTTQQSAKAAQIAAKTSIKTAEKAAIAAKQAARTAERTARATIRATIAAVKAIIAATKALISAIAAGGWIAVLILVLVILFGGILCMTGGDNSNTVSPVSAEVQAYEPVIRQYANQYGIPEYVELIKAVMMQESGGRGLDPMQSSEGGFNTRYPREPNGITDPDYSISCGVQELKAALDSAGVESPIDMEHIKLALQGYNFGNGYISWAKSNYGGYSLANAIEFSDMKAAELGWSNYGDKQYVPHVLRYYTFGRIPIGMGSQAIVQVALSQEGNVGGQPYWSWYGFNSRVEWCACFVSWCAEQCGYIQSGVIPKFSSVSAGVDWFAAKGQFRDASYVPAAGDLIFFDWENNGTIDHVGIVENVTGGTVNTIEGNSGDKCARRSYSMGSSSIYGYGVPAY